MTPNGVTAEDRVVRWEAATEWPLMIVALAFLVGYAWPILQPGLSHPAKALCHVVDLAAWLAFLLDYCARLGLARRRWHYWSRHLADLAVIALPILRPLRLLRLIMLLKALNRGATATLRGRIAVYVAGGTVLLILCGALAILDAERGHPGANITNFGDALWWATVTISTVGYGDRFPVTGEGRAVAIGLMLGGIALLGVVTASIASWLIDSVRAAETSAQAATRADIAELSQRIEDLHTLLARIVDDRQAGVASGARTSRGGEG